MTGGAVTFDFHNTLARCDAWFELEVRRLVSAYLAWQAAQQGVVAEPPLLAAADAAYRRLRNEIADHGNELSADACVARVLTDLGVPADPQLIRRGVEALMRDTLADVSPLPGAIDTVRALNAAGVPLGVVSSAVYHPFLEWTLDHFGVGDAFAEVTTSASAGFYKSRPEIFWHAAASLGVAPGRVVHVGDSYRWDVGGAQRAGLRTVWVAGDGAASHGDGVAPDLTLDSLVGADSALLNMLRDAGG